MATTSVLIPVEEYLRTSYRPDCDYIDGEVLERSVGEKPHSRLQAFFVRYFAAFEEEWRFETLTQQRVQVRSDKFRVPDVALVPLSRNELLIVETPPLLCIEVLSSGDYMGEVQKRLNDYAAMGFRSMWIVDPWRRLAYFAGVDVVRYEVADRLIVEGTSISITVAEVFAELDRLEARAAGR